MQCTQYVSKAAFTSCLITFCKSQPALRGYQPPSALASLVSSRPASCRFCNEYYLYVMTLPLPRTRCNEPSRAARLKSVPATLLSNKLWQQSVPYSLQPSNHNSTGHYERRLQLGTMAVRTRCGEAARRQCSPEGLPRSPWLHVTYKKLALQWANR